MLKRTLRLLAGLAAAALGLAGLAIATPVAHAAAPEPVLIGDRTLSGFVTANRADENLFMRAKTDQPAPGYQLWTLNLDDKTGLGTVVNSATGGCLSVYRVVIGDRHPVVQRPCDGQPTQLWTVEPTFDGLNVFVNAYSGRCMGFESVWTGQFSQLLEYDCTGAPNQAFRLAS